MIGLGASLHLIVTVAAEHRRAVGGVYERNVLGSSKRASAVPSRWNSDGVWSLTQA